MASGFPLKYLVFLFFFIRLFLKNNPLWGLNIWKGKIGLGGFPYPPKLDQSYNPFDCFIQHLKVLSSLS
jgi:hypothetical protein